MKCLGLFAHPKAMGLSTFVLLKKTGHPNLSLSGRSEMKGDFYDSFRKSVDDALKQIFGQAAALIIYNHLEKNSSLTSEEIPEKLEVFAKGLENFLNSGALVIEGIILKQLYLSYGLEFKKMEEGTSFVDYVTKLKRMINENTKKRKNEKRKLNDHSCIQGTSYRTHQHQHPRTIQDAGKSYLLANVSAHAPPRG